MTKMTGTATAFECVARTHAGLRRPLNEDAVLAAPRAGLWAVADGMGGHEAGEVASALVVESLQNGVAPGDLATRVEAARTALAAANAALIQMAAGGASRGSIGTTVVLLVADEARYACLWAGDSRAYLKRAGALIQLTRDHSLVQELVDAGLLSVSEAASHPEAHVIRRAVGVRDDLRLEAVEGALAGGDLFLLASDGLTRVLTDPEILACLDGSDLAAAADRLVALTLKRGAPDNVSVVLVRRA